MLDIQQDLSLLINTYTLNSGVCSVRLSHLYAQEEPQVLVNHLVYNQREQRTPNKQSITMPDNTYEVVYTVRSAMNNKLLPYRASIEPKS
jgi:hypothetical protein